jgi:hypothetical protein
LCATTQRRPAHFFFRLNQNSALIQESSDGMVITHHIAEHVETLEAVNGIARSMRAAASLPTTQLIGI